MHMATLDNLSAQAQDKDNLIDITSILRAREYLESEGFNPEEINIMIDLSFYPKDLNPEQTQKAEALFKSLRDRKDN